MKAFILAAGEGTDSTSKVINLPFRGGEEGLRVALSIEKAIQIGYVPNIPVDHGLAKTIVWLKTL